MDELNDLIRQQASYSSLVAWVQKRTGRSYRDACLTVNRVMRRYRHQHQAPRPHPAAPAS
jgi:hypothetical protein